MTSEPDAPPIKMGRWAASARWPLLIVAAATIPLNVGAQLARSDGRDEAVWLDLGIRAVQLVLAVDLVIRVSATTSRWGYVRQHKLDVLAILVPPLRLLREFDLIRGVFLRSGLQRFVTFAVASLVVGAAMVFASERGQPDATITSFGDAIWWAAVTSTTVGYGDRVPTTLEGRVIAVALMLLGIALFAVLTAHVAARFVTDDRGEQELLAAIDERLRRIERHLLSDSSSAASDETEDPM